MTRPLTIDAGVRVGGRACPAPQRDRLLRREHRPPVEERPSSPWPFLPGELHEICDAVDAGREPVPPAQVVDPLAREALRQAGAGYAALLRDGELDPHAERDPLGEFGPSARVPAEWLDPAGEAAVVLSGWRPRVYRHPDGSAEIRRVHLARPGSWTPADARSSALTCAVALALVEPDLPRVRARSVFCADRAVVELFDLSRPQLLATWQREALPPLLALARAPAGFRPGSGCASCDYLVRCARSTAVPAVLSPVRLPGLTARPGAARPGLLALSPQTVLDALRCPARAAARAMHLPGQREEEESGSAPDPRQRGEAVHAWVARAHARGRRCEPADVADAELAAGIEPDLLDTAMPYLAQHAAACLLPGPARSRTERRYALHDPTAGVLLAVQPDGLWVDPDGRTHLHELKTCRQPPVHTPQQLLEREVAASVYLTVLASGALGEPGSVHFEYLAPAARARPLVIELPASDGPLVAAAAARVAAAVDALWAPLERAEAHPTRPGRDTCEGCPARRWCRDGSAPVSTGAG